MFDVTEIKNIISKNKIKYDKLYKNSFFDKIFNMSTIKGASTILIYFILFGLIHHKIPLDFMKDVINNKKTDIYQIDNSGLSALYWLMFEEKSWSEKVLNLFLTNKKMKINNEIFEGGYTILICACFFHNVKFVKQILKNPKVNVNLLNVNKNSALIATLDNKEYLNSDEKRNYQKNAISIIKELYKIKNINVNIKNVDGWSVLHHAVMNDKYPFNIFREVLKHPKIDVNIKYQGDTLLHFIIKMQLNPGFLKELLKHPKINVNQKNKDGDSAIFYIVSQFKQHENYSKYLELLLNHKKIDKILKNSNDGNNTILISLILEFQMFSSFVYTKILLDHFTIKSKSFYTEMIETLNVFFSSPEYNKIINKNKLKKLFKNKKNKDFIKNTKKMITELNMENLFFIFHKK